MSENMRYKLNLDGYVNSVSFGCALGNCTEYTGAVPLGYNTLVDWATYAEIQAYYLDSSGNFTLDVERLAQIRQKAAKDLVDNTPLYRKDLYGTESVIETQYIKGTKTASVVTLENINTVPPKVKITGVNTSICDKFYVYTQGRNVMPFDAVSETISGMTFTKNSSGSVNIAGTATEDIEYTVSGSASNTIPLFSVKKGKTYYALTYSFPFTFQYEFRYFDGETTSQIYLGNSTATFTPTRSEEVTHVVMKIPKGSRASGNTLIPYLGLTPTPANYKGCYSLEIDFSEYVDETIDYILIEKGVIYALVGGVLMPIDSGNVGLFSDYSTIYVTKIGTTLEVEYSTNTIDVKSMEFLQGKQTTSSKFKILEDGSIEATNGKFSGTIESENAVITGGSISLISEDSAAKITLKNSEDTINTQVSPSGYIIENSSTKKATSLSSTAGMMVKYDGTKTVEANGSSAGGYVNVYDADGNKTAFVDGISGTVQGTTVKTAAGVDLDDVNANMIKNKIVNKVSGQTVTVDISDFYHSSKTWGILVTAHSWVSKTAATSIFYYNPVYANSYVASGYLVQGTYGPTITISEKTMTITFYNSTGGAYGIIKII